MRRIWLGALFAREGGGEENQAEPTTTTTETTQAEAGRGGVCVGGDAGCNLHPSQ